MIDEIIFSIESIGMYISNYYGFFGSCSYFGKMEMK